MTQSENDAFLFLYSTALAAKSNSQLDFTEHCSPKAHQSGQNYVFTCGLNNSSFLTWVFNAQFNLEVAFKTKKTSMGIITYPETC